MSKVIASAAIRGAKTIVARAQDRLNEALGKYGPDKPVAFPNTNYYLPVIYAMTGEAVEKLGDIQKIIDMAAELMPAAPREKVWVPYLGETLDSGMAALWADEIIEALKYVEGEDCPYTKTTSPTDYNIWLGAADDVILRERGIEFVDGSAPGFAAILGAAPDVETAVRIARELQEKSLYVFISSNKEGVSFADQLKEGGVEMGWETRLVPFGVDTTATVFALGFAVRAAMAFGLVQPGDFKKNLLYNKNRIFAFAMALGPVSDEQFAQAAGAINFGFPAIADTGIPEILPRGLTTYEHVVSAVPHDKIVQKAIEVRGLKIIVDKPDIPVGYSPAFEGERVRKDAVHVQMGGTKSDCFELLQSVDLDSIEDGKVTVVGPDVDETDENSALPLALVVKIAGRNMNKDYEPIMERQFHHWINGAEGVMHIGQRDVAWIRVSKKAKEQGFKLEHLGRILRSKLLSEFQNAIDKVEVEIYSDQDRVTEGLVAAREIYSERDHRLEGMTDESVDTFYSCMICQSFAPTQVCVISPERLGLCGAFNWLDGKVGSEIDPTGGHKPVPKGEVIDAKLGEFSGVNEFVMKHSQGTLDRLSLYSMIHNPMTSCGCFEAILAIMPMTNAVMVVDRDSAIMTPSGMSFSTMAGLGGGGVQTPGFLGVGKYYLGSPKFLFGDGGFSRIAWMPSSLKEQMRPLLQQQAERIGDPDFINKIADENTATTEDEVIEHMNKVGHPALTMDPIM